MNTLPEILQKVPTSDLLAEIARRSPRKIDAAHEFACHHLQVNPQDLRSNRRRHRILIPARQRIIRLMVNTLGYTGVEVAEFYGLDPSGIGHAIRADQRRCQDSFTAEQDWLALRRSIRAALGKPEETSP